MLPPGGNLNTLQSSQTDFIMPTATPAAIRKKKKKKEKNDLIDCVSFWTPSNQIFSSGQELFSEHWCWILSISLLGFL